MTSFILSLIPTPTSVEIRKCISCLIKIEHFLINLNFAFSASKQAHEEDGIKSDCDVKRCVALNARYRCSDKYYYHN